MTGLHMSLTVLTIALTVSGAMFYGAIVLYGAWIDGRRQRVREKGLHPVTESTGEVHGEDRIGKEESGDGSKRS